MEDVTMNSEEIIAEIRRYESELEGILSRFSHGRERIHINREDDPLLRQFVRELIDLFNDALGSNSYSSQIRKDFNEGVANYYDTPSYKSVGNILAIVRAAITRFSRSPELLDRKNAQDNLKQRENVFIIHGRDEAKWRELKDIVKTELRLNPIILLEQPDAGCKTVIEKFEHYAQTCSYAIAVFTPDDEVTSGGETYLQARPNVIYELGWFCGRLGRSGVMLILKEDTSLFSDFGGIIQKRFKISISERVIEIKRDLVSAGVIDDI